MLTLNAVWQVAAVDTELGYISKDEIDKLGEDKPELKETLLEFAKKRSKHEQRRKTALKRQLNTTFNEGTRIAHAAKFTAWLGHLSDSSCDEFVIRSAMKQFGEVESILIRHKAPDDSGAARSWAFVVFNTSRSMHKAVESTTAAKEDGSGPIGVTIGTDTRVAMSAAKPDKLRNTPLMKLHSDDLNMLDTCSRVESTLSNEGMRLLKASATRRDYVQGVSICTKDEQGSIMFVMLSGTANEVGDVGEKPKQRSRGESFGVDCLVRTGACYTESLVAATDVSCLCVEQRAYSEAHAKDHQSVPTVGVNQADDSEEEDGTPKKRSPQRRLTLGSTGLVADILLMKKKKREKSLAVLQKFASKAPATPRAAAATPAPVEGAGPGVTALQQLVEKQDEKISELMKETKAGREEIRSLTKLVQELAGKENSKDSSRETSEQKQ